MIFSDTCFVCTTEVSVEKPYMARYGNWHFAMSHSREQSEMNGAATMKENNVKEKQAPP
jgi:hypothetical protein